MPDRTLVSECDIAFDDGIFTFSDHCHIHILEQIGEKNHPFVIMKKMMKTVRVDDIVEFHMNDLHLYGVVERKFTDEDENILLFIRVKNHLYRNIPAEAVIHDFGRDE